MRLLTLKSLVHRKPKGAFASILYERNLPVRTLYKNNTIVSKRTQCIVRCGVEYDHIAAVKENRQLGVLPSQNAGLSWGEWEEYPFFIVHKGLHYLRVARVIKAPSHTEYRLNGRVVPKEEVIQYCTKDAFRENPVEPQVLSINVDNILAFI